MKYIKLFYPIMYSIYTSSGWALKVAVPILSVRLQLTQGGVLHNPLAFEEIF